jgi:RimJ/RimL family protein N-acetyltransferase
MGFLLKGYNNYFGEFRIVSMNVNSEEDYTIYKNIVINPTLMKSSSLFNGKVASEKEAKEDFKLKTKSNDLYGIGFGKILDKDNNVLGITGLIVVDEQNEKPTGAEIGIFLNRNAQGKSLPGDVAKLLINFVFYRKNIKYILSTAFASTFPSQIELIKLDFKYFYAFLDKVSKKRINCFVLKKERHEKTSNKRTITNTRKFIKEKINSQAYSHNLSNHNKIIEALKKSL